MPRLGLENSRLLITGNGSYLADLEFEGCVDVCFVRSPFPHAEIARVCPPVGSGLSGAELGIRPLQLESRGLVSVPWDPIAIHRVRYVGESVAVVWGKDRYEAEDAVDATEVDYDRLPDGIPVHPEAPDDVLFSTTFDSGGFEEASSAAHAVIEGSFQAARQSALPIECRGVAASHDSASGVTTVWTSTQIPHLVRKGIALGLGVDEDLIRVLVPHVGGGFGVKAQVFAEEIALAALTRRINRPVRWIEDRWENLVASAHAHDTGVTMRVAVARDGTFLGVDADVVADVGAYSVWPFSASLEPATAAASLFGPYAIRAIKYRARGIASHRCPVGAHRGVGINAGVYATERMVDTIAHELDIDPFDIRRLNAIRTMPCTTAAGRELDSGDYLGLLDRLASASAYQEHRRSQRQSRREHRLVGVGIGFFNEHSGSGPSDYRRRGVTTISGEDSARVVVTHEGRLQIYTSAAEAGQGHAETYRALAGRELDIAPEMIDVFEGDTDACPKGTGTFASRGGVGVIEAVVQALRKVAQLDIAPGTDVTHVHEAKQLYPSGAHLAVVEVDTDTLVPRVLRYVAIEDCGTILHADIVDEQVRGGIANGVGCALLEEHRYSAEGQILTASLLDYLVPLVSDIPHVELHHLTNPSPGTTLGSKGVGEAGTIGAIAAVSNAVADAVFPLGVRLTALPYSPTRISDGMPEALPGR
jgi:aerobic carbon-monoxide dehydrogenase large subunit